MHEIIQCPNCRKRLRLADEHTGKEVQCPVCEARFVAGAKAAAAAPAPAERELDESVRAQVRPLVPERADEAEQISGLWRRLLPAWIGLAIGTLFAVLFLLLGPGQEPADRPKLPERFRVETVDGRGASVHYWTVPVLLPAMGFFGGLFVFLYKKATDKSHSQAKEEQEVRDFMS